MSPELLLQHFHRISESPDAIPRLRRFILDLAVRGKLVEQDPNDEPASELLKRIQKEKMRLVNNVKTSKNQTLQITNLNDVPFDMPYQWECIRLISIGKTQTGTTPPSNSPELFGDYIPFVKPADLTGNMINYSGDGISEEGIKYSRLIQKNSVMMVCIGSSIGKVNINYRDVCCNQQINTLTPYTGNITNFIAISLKSTYFQNLVIANAGMGTLPILSKGKWETLPIPLPPLAEQHRIVAKVDELMALCDQLETAKNERESRRSKLVASSLDRIVNSEGEEARDAAQFHLNYLQKLTANKDHIKLLRQSILNLAVRGRLVEQDPNDEPASELLKRIQKEKMRLISENKIRKHINTIFGLIENEDYNIPTNWKWCRLGNICFIITDGTHYTPKYENSGVPFLSVKDVSGGYIDFANTRFISEYEHRELCKRCKPEFGDILLTKVGTTGISVTVDINTEFSIFVSLALLKFSHININKYFLSLLINSPFVKQQSAENTQGIGNKNLVLRLINQFRIPLPPLQEQHRIVAKVDELMAICDKLESQLTTSESDSRRLCEAVLRDVLNRGNLENKPFADAA